jgi:hypothetical protein
MRYAHVRPALMISNFLKSTQDGNVDTTVLCQGYGFEENEKWWVQQETKATPGEVARFIVESEAFISYQKTTRTKKIKRLCIWVLCMNHTFMVAWEQGKCHDVIFFADSAVGDADIDRFRNEFLLKFKDCLLPYRSSDIMTRELFKTSIFSTSDVEIQDDLMCVSFMARSTAYLNGIEFVLDTTAPTNLIVHFADVRFQANCYVEFEKTLENFLTNRLITQKTVFKSKLGLCNSMCVWLPAAMKNKFLNINDICLMVFNANNKTGHETAHRYEFFLGEHSSFKRVIDNLDGSSIDIGSGPKCIVASEYGTTLLMRGCRNALDDALGLLSK